MPLPRLFVIGDSISMHYGPFLECYTRGRFTYARKTGEEEALRGTPLAGNANGGDSAAVLGYLEALCGAGALRADVLLLNCGLHDLKTDPVSGEKQVPLARYTEHLSRIAALAREAAGQVAWVRTTPVNDALHNNGSRAFHRYNRDVEAYNAAAAAVMWAAGIPLADAYTFTANLPGDITADGVHFLEPVRALQAAFLAGFAARIAVEVHP